MYTQSIYNDITRYMKLSECDTLRWNIDKIEKALSDKKMLPKVYEEVYSEGFVSSKELKQRFKTIFDKYGIKLAPKGSLIEGCTQYSVTKLSKRVNGKPTKGYILSR